MSVKSGYRPLAFEYFRIIFFFTILPRVSECWMFYVIPTARVISMAKTSVLIQLWTKTGLDLFSLG